MKKKYLFILLIIILTLFSCSDNPIINESSETKEEQNEQITVYICGEVKYPGIYNIDDKSRLYDLINLAGGFTKDAKINEINLARFLNNNEMIIIEKVNENNQSKQININQATKEELMRLKGIGESKAIAIINYRKEVGMFTNISDLLKVKGISETIYNEIKDQITV